MKKRLQSRNILLVLGFALSLSSCTFIDYDFHSASDFSKSRGQVKYIWISSSESDFLSGRGVSSVNYEEQGYRIRPDISTRTYFVDARTENGYSNWSGNRVNYSIYAEGKQYNEFSIIYEELFKSEIIMDTPPAHLHMVLNSFNENPVGKIPSKIWKVLAIKDNNGQSLETDPDWSNYTDNLMRFKKANTFVLYLGKKRTSIENDLFGTADSITGNYSVYIENPSDIENTEQHYLSIGFPNYNEKFRIVDSDWKKLTITGTIKGKTGTMTLVP